ncbi:MAG: DsbA family protein [Hyphomicrobiaceae bacterium]
MTDISSADHDNGERLHFIYFADPMCSWCYGFAPVIRALAQQFEGRLPVRLVMGGLRAGNTKAMTEKDREYIRGAWTRVGEASGQPFDFSFFDREHFVYDTEPACRAVVTMRRLAPEKALAFKARVSRAFYGENRDTTDVKVLAALAPEFDIDAERFELEMLSADVRNETFRDFLTSQQAGVQGFPLLAAGSEAGGYALVTNGFRPLDGLPEAIESWLAAGAPVRPAMQEP